MSHRGQALIEALVCGTIWATGIFVILKIGFSITAAIWLDEVAEQYLFCKGESCREQLENKLQPFGLKLQSVSLIDNNLELAAESKLTGILYVRKKKNLR